MKPEMVARHLRDAEWQAVHGNPNGALALYRRLFASGYRDVETFKRYRRLHLTHRGIDLPHHEIFDMIYRAEVWGSRGNEAAVSSGYGSTGKATAPYRDFLVSFMRDKNIRSVVDIGCGDWELGRLVDWTGVDYTGVDVSAVILENTSRFTADGIRFIEGDARTIDLPRADLLLMKDVLQHWSNDDIKRFLPKIGGYRHALLTNGAPLREAEDINHDIPAGNYHALDLTRPPFAVAGTFVLTYKSVVTEGDGKRAIDFKRVLHVESNVA
ncbi:MAG: class I SAM-dependent methyltransferase [Bauldia sp.]